MSVVLFICLIFATTIGANDLNTSLDELTPRDNYYHDGNFRKLVTEPTGSVINTNITENKTASTANDKPETETEGLQADSSQVFNSYPPYTSYEVTENFIDIPDDRTPAGPVVTNFSIRPNLNLGKPSNKTDIDRIAEANIKTKKNRVTILHINAEFDDKVNEVNNDKFGGIFKGIKNYFYNIHRNIVSSFHSLFHKHQDQHDHGERFERAAPAK